MAPRKNVSFAIGSSRHRPAAVSPNSGEPAAMSGRAQAEDGLWVSLAWFPGLVGAEGDRRGGAPADGGGGRREPCRGAVGARLGRWGGAVAALGSQGGARAAWSRSAWLLDLATADSDGGHGRSTGVGARLILRGKGRLPLYRRCALLSVEGNEYGVVVRRAEGTPRSVRRSDGVPVRPVRCSARPGA
jgi:hypothetical protein